jgi:cytochrome o ubiquinol oxidase subunit 2
MKKTNKIKKRIITLIISVLIIVGLGIWYFHDKTVAVLNPRGPIALKEFHLIVFALLLSLTIVIPVFILTAVFAYRYRETNTKAKYSPELDHNKYAETIWWVIPSILIAILGVVAWNSSHTLDPYRPIYSNRPAMTIQVVALDWKWLFIYPKQNIASVNLVQFPNNTPINFEITSDAPMNSFWIPQLGGQIYAMPGMSTQLHLLASQNGSYNGSSANISGEGFAGMTFIARSSSTQGFNDWLNSVKKSPNKLSLAEYNKLSGPSQNNPVSYYSSAQYGLYNNIVYKYLVPSSGAANPDNSGKTQAIPNLQQIESQGMQGMSM